MAKRRPKGTGSIRNRGTERHPRYFARYDVTVDGERRWVSEGPFDLKEDAENWLSEELTRKRRGRPTLPGKVTYGEVLDEWLAVTRPRLAPNTWLEYERHVRLRLRPHLGHHRIRELRPGHIAGMYEALRQPGANLHSTRGDRRVLTETSLTRVHSALNASLRWAVRQGLIAHNPAADVVRPKPGDTEMQVWTAEELNRFLAGAAEDRLFPLWRLAAFTGMRRSELLGLQWGDVDLREATVAVRRSRIVVGAQMETRKRTKSRRGTRVVDVDPETVAVLRRWRRAQKAERLAWGPAYATGPWVFTRADGEPLRGRFVTGRFEKARDLAGSVSNRGRGGRPQWFARFSTVAGDGRRWAREGPFARRVDAQAWLDGRAVSRIRLHDLRHTHASLLLAAGVPPVDVAARIGDSLETLLRTYAHVIPNRGHLAAAEFTRILGG